MGSRRIERTLCIFPVPFTETGIISVAIGAVGGAITILVRHFSTRTKRALQEAQTRKLELDFQVQFSETLRGQVEQLRADVKGAIQEQALLSRENGLLKAENSDLQQTVDRLSFDKDTIRRDLENARIQAESDYENISRRLESLDKFLRTGRSSELE